MFKTMPSRLMVWNVNGVSAGIFAENSGVRVALWIEDRVAFPVELAQRNLAEDPVPLVGEVLVVPTLVRAVAAMGVGLESDEPERPDVAVGVLSGIGALGSSCCSDRSRTC